MFVNPGRIDRDVQMGDENAPANRSVGAEQNRPEGPESDMENGRWITESQMRRHLDKVLEAMREAWSNGHGHGGSTAHAVFTDEVHHMRVMDSVTQQANVGRQVEHEECALAQTLHGKLCHAEVSAQLLYEEHEMRRHEERTVAGRTRMMDLQAQNVVGALQEAVEAEESTARQYHNGV